MYRLAVVSKHTNEVTMSTVVMSTEEAVRAQMHVSKSPMVSGAYLVEVESIMDDSGIDTVMQSIDDMIINNSK